MAFLDKQGLATLLAQIKGWVDSKLENEYAKVEKLPSTHELTLPAGRLIGDIDGDGMLSLSDAELIRKHVMSKSLLADDLLALADVAKAGSDGTVNAADYMMVKNFALSTLAVSAVKQNSNIGDTQGNWQLYGADDEIAGLWYCDIAITDCESSDSIVVTMTDFEGSRLSDASIKVITYTGGSTDDCYLRIITKKVPTIDVPIYVNITHDGGGNKTLVYKEPAPAKYQTEVTLTHDDWSLAVGATEGNGAVYTCTCDDLRIRENSAVICSVIDDGVQQLAAMAANVRYLTLTDGQIVFAAFGAKPTSDITMNVVII